MTQQMTLPEHAERIIAANPNMAALKPVIMKELVHYDVLYHIRQSGLMTDNLVFIGGTCLRLCHGSSRLSEDLDFHAGESFSPRDFDTLRESLERYLYDRYRLPVEVKEPKELLADPEYANSRASTWKIVIQTEPAQRHLPRQRIHIDIANIPTHRAAADIVQVNYDGLPDGYDTIFVMRSDKTEILADKFLALGARNNIKARDLWDILWLKQHGAVLDIDLLNTKIQDHGIANFRTLLDTKLDLLPAYWQSGNFNAEMSRFLDSTGLQNTINRNGYTDVLARKIQEDAQLILAKL